MQVIGEAGLHAVERLAKLRVEDVHVRQVAMPLVAAVVEPAVKVLAVLLRQRPASGAAGRYPVALQPIDVRRAVDPVAGDGPARGSHQPDAVVVVQGPHRHAGQIGHPADGVFADALNYQPSRGVRVKRS